MISVLQITVQQSPQIGEPNKWIVDLRAENGSGRKRKWVSHSWECDSYKGCLDGLPALIENVTNQKHYA